MTTTTNATPVSSAAVALITRLILDERVSMDKFMRDIIHHDFERRQWLVVRPFIDFGRSKDPIGAQHKATRLIDSEASVKYQLAYVCHYGFRTPIPKLEHTNVRQALVRVMQHVRGSETALSILDNVADLSLLEDTCVTLLAAPENTLAPEVLTIVRNIAKRGTINKGHRPRLIPNIAEAPWQQQPLPAKVAGSTGKSGGLRRNQMAIMAAMSAMGVGHIPNR